MILLDKFYYYSHYLIVYIVIQVLKLEMALNEYAFRYLMILKMTS